MGLKEDLESECKTIFAATWSGRKGEKVPETEDIQLGNYAVNFEEAVVLYADIVRSTELVHYYKDQFAAEIYKTFLYCVCRVIRDLGGVITAFDGDRVMAVFLGDAKRTQAAKCGLKIHYVVDNIITPAQKNQYPNTTFTLSHCVGIDVSKLLVARTGIRGSNDLVWVGRSANYAAGLCSVRDGEYATYVTADVYNQLANESKYGEKGLDMWHSWWWAERAMSVYRSNWWWSV